MKKIIPIFIICIFLIGCSSENKVEKVTCDEMKKLLEEENTILIDVRTKEEYEEKHLENAINIPLDSLENEISNYENIDKDTKIIVYCKSGKRSNGATEILKKKDYKKIYDLGAMSNCD